MKQFLFFFVTAAVLLSSCSQDSETDNAGDFDTEAPYLIGFSTTLKDSTFQKAEVTRATPITAATISSYGMSCSSYPKDKNFITAGCGSYFYNEEVDALTGKTNHFWPGPDYKVSFFAYTPYNSSCISLVSNASTNGMPQYRYVVPETVTDQVDFMTCNILDHEGWSTQPVPLTFKHKCAAIRFVAENTASGDIELLSIQVVGVKYDGILQFDEWSLQGNVNSVTDHPFIYTINYTLSPGETKDITGNDGCFMILPQTVSAGTDIIVVKTRVLGSECTYTHQLPSDLQLKAGNSYLYKLKIGYKTITITPSISSTISEKSENDYIYAP